MINTTRLRLLIGQLGIALPQLVSLAIGYIPGSISETYYTNAQAIFMIVLGSSGFLLFSYRGYDLLDDIISSLAGLFGLGVCLFPCQVSNPGEITGTFKLPILLSNKLHCTCAILFFVLLAIMSLFQFTKSSGEKTNKKQYRNIIYIICGCGMSLSMMLIPLSGLIPWNKLIQFVETVALFFFGISQLTKANVYKQLFAD